MTGFCPTDYLNFDHVEERTAPPEEEFVSRARVLFDFPGSGENEMKLRKGDVVNVLKKGTPGSWCKGESGAFPTDYVEFISAETNIDTKAPEQYDASQIVSQFVSKSSSCGKVLQTFMDSEISRRPVSSTSSDQEMFFPSGDSSSEDARSVLEYNEQNEKLYARVKFGRDADGPNEISIMVDDILQVVKQDSEWWYGSSVAEKKLGFFPANYVEVVDFETVLYLA